MPRQSAAAKLSKMLDKLMAERKQHVQVIAKHQGELDKIDQLFSGYGITFGDAAPAATRGKPGRKPGPKTASKAGKSKGRRGRGSYAKTAEQTVLDFVKKAGNPSTKDINDHWAAQGRGGKADNTLTRLTSEGQLKRVKSADVRGSRYTLA